MQYPVEVLNRAADIFRMARHMLRERLLLSSHGSLFDGV